MWDDDEDDEADGPVVNWAPGGEGRGDDPADWSDADDDNTINWRQWE